ncbi:hypothetical protein OAM01_02155 [bacterium]|nr:hypothetical protein [bacterium]
MTGTVDGREGDACFYLAKEMGGNRNWMSRPGPLVGLRHQGSALLCLDCGRVTVSLTAEIGEATEMIQKWGITEIKTRLQSSD